MSETIFKVSILPCKGGNQQFSINGVPSPRLELQIGKTYIFQLNKNLTKIHDFYLCSSAIGGYGDYRDKIEYEQYMEEDNFCVKYTPTSKDINQNLYYQCNKHSIEGYKIKIVEK